MFLFRHPQKMGEKVEDEFTSTMRAHILRVEQGSWGTKLTHRRQCEHHKVYLGLSHLPATVANEGLWGSPTRNVIILVASVTGQGDN